MPVRGSTAWLHARVGKKIINHDSGDGRKVICAWDTCEKPGLSIYEVRVHQHADGYKATDERYMHYPFCSENHKQYWLNAIRPGSSNNLPPGYRLV